MNELTVALPVLFLLLSSADAHAETIGTKEALARAMRKNPTLSAAIAEVRGAQAAVASEEARYDPTLTVTAVATHARSPNLATNRAVNVGTSDVLQSDLTLKKKFALGTETYASVGGTWTRTATPLFLGSANQTGGASPTPVVLSLGPGYLASVKVGVTQPLLRGAGRDVNLALLQQAEVQRSAAELSRDREASTLARDLLTAYWELWYAATSVDVDRVARDTAQKQRDDAEARRQTGSLASADVLTFETQLASKEETLRQAELDRRQRENDLARLMGDDAAPEGLSVADDPPRDAGELTGDLLGRAAAQSPELREQEAAVKLASVKERTAADAYRARLDLDAYVQAQGLGNQDIGAAASQLVGLGALSAHVGLTYEQPLSGDRRRAESNRAAAATEAARSTLSATKQALAASVDTAARKRLVAKDRVTLAEKTVDIATRQLDAEQARFASGSATAIQVVQAQDQVQSAKLRLARARADYLQGHLALAHLVGALLPEASAAMASR